MHAVLPFANAGRWGSKPMSCSRIGTAFIDCKDTDGGEDAACGDGENRAGDTALALAGGGAYVGIERPRPPLVIRVAAQQEESGVGHTGSES